MNSRLVRTGQEKETTIWRLICPGTIDEVVAEVLRSKDEDQRGLMRALHFLKKL